MMADFPPVFPCAEQTGLLAAIDAIADPDAAPAVAARLREFAASPALARLDGQSATRLLSQLNDRLTSRLIALLVPRFRLPTVDWCWLALGSEGRHEQSFVTDQDNGLVFAAVDQREAEALRALFVPFAQAVNQHLAACGFALCSGEVMAGNPRWCLSLDEWREHFIDWVRRPDPDALLNASIFFDLRPLYGHRAFGESLRRLMLGLTSDSPAFLHLMAANALAAEPPLNFRGEIAGGDKEAIDLKKFGSRIFVDVARIFALASATPAVNTGERLQLAGPQCAMRPEELAAVDAAFSHMLRLRVLAQRLNGSNEIRLADLHEFDRAILRETLRQARRLQSRLKLNYSL